MKIVRVTWKDITSDDGWHGADELDVLIHESNTVEQVGFLYEEDEEQIILLDSYFTNRDRFGCLHRIPKGCIIEIKEMTIL
jgi:hypothetical protein